MPSEGAGRIREKETVRARRWNDKKRWYDRRYHSSASKLSDCKGNRPPSGPAFSSVCSLVLPFYRTLVAACRRVINGKKPEIAFKKGEWICFLAFFCTPAHP